MQELTTYALELLIGGVVGFTIGMTGVGGGVLIVPALTVLLGLPATAAVGTASAYAFATKVFAGIEHWRLRTIDWAMAHLFLIGAIPGNIAACLVIGHYKQVHAGDSAGLASLQSQLKSFIAGVMVFSVILMLANLMRERRNRSEGAEPTPPPATMPLRRRLLGVILGALVGALIGSTSVGGGVIIVPLLIICFGLTTRTTVGTSIYIALVLTLATTVLSAGRGDVDWLVAGLMSVGSLLGAPLGSRLAARVSDLVLQLAVAALLLVAIAGMLLR